jgi:uncharacterized membrane protein (GlpM family)
MKELIIRLVVGGTAVSFFAVLGDLFKPKSIAGPLGAAPSVALATLSLTALKDGKAYAQTEARSMIVGAIAFLIYALCVSRLLVRHRLPALAVTASSILTWMAAAFGLWYAVLR